MPIYEYACKSCGKAMEIRQKFSDDPLTDCPACGAPTLERLVSASSFSLKGSGWYADGYGNTKPSAEAKDSGTKEGGSKEGGSKEGGSKDSGGKDTKTPGDSKKETSAKTETKKAS